MSAALAPADREVARLRERLELAEERVAQLECALDGSGAWAPPAAWGLTPSEASLLGVLVHRALATREAILAARPFAFREEPGPQLCDVVMHRLRRKLAAAGVSVAIDTVWGSGWRMRRDDQARIKALG